MPVVVEFALSNVISQRDRYGRSLRRNYVPSNVRAVSGQYTLSVNNRYLIGFEWWFYPVLILRSTG